MLVCSTSRLKNNSKFPDLHVVQTVFRCQQSLPSSAAAISISCIAFFTRYNDNVRLFEFVKRVNISISVILNVL